MGHTQIDQSVSVTVRNADSVYTWLGGSDHSWWIWMLLWLALPLSSLDQIRSLQDALHRVTPKDHWDFSSAEHRCLLISRAACREAYYWTAVLHVAAASNSFPSAIQVVGVDSGLHCFSPSIWDSPSPLCFTRPLMCSNIQRFTPKYMEGWPFSVKGS